LLSFAVVLVVGTAMTSTSRSTAEGKSRHREGVGLLPDRRRGTGGEGKVLVKVLVRLINRSDEIIR
jgi:hypothetical protein